MGETHHDSSMNEMILHEYNIFLLNGSNHSRVSFVSPSHSNKRVVPLLKKLLFLQMDGLFLKSIQKVEEGREGYAI